MLHLKVVAVGKIKERYLQEGIAEYRKRLRPYARLTIEEVPDEPLRDGGKKARETEGERILARAGASAYLVALDRGGKVYSSEEFAAWLGEREMAGKEVVFVIGGTTGLSEQVLEKADTCLSFSRLTFPHQLFRLFLLEQIYRAFKILRGEPYHW
ncbi:MAG TPA: 23S rRNA (pseudouridine(1915)-N(3))-methyltransferase RlmH [Firmicutes bacterium]|nr:23S rRNA (pseudouridine(1915)-N(3))-methyltransferase RlmH [Bacillota bacterium]